MRVPCKPSIRNRLTKEIKTKYSSLCLIFIVASIEKLGSASFRLEPHLVWWNALVHSYRNH